MTVAHAGTRCAAASVSFPPGGATDVFSRATGAEITKSLGQQVVIENRPGAGTTIAADIVAKAEPDGHTLLLLTNGNAVSQALFKSLPYDPVNDFAMISTVGLTKLRTAGWQNCDV